MNADAAGPTNFWPSPPAQATSHPSLPPPANMPHLFNGPVAGTDERSCVQVGDAEIVRSGEIVAGNFAAFRAGMRASIGWKLWWEPLHQDALGTLSKPKASLTVWGLGLDGQGTYFERHRYLGLGSDGLFFPDGPRLPSLGRWRLVAVTGPDWGCFDVGL